MKKFLSLCLALVMVLGIMPMSAFAAECDHSDWAYEEIPNLDYEENPGLDNEEIPASGKHTKTCQNCGVSEVEDCEGCCETGCKLCGSEMIGLHPDNDEDYHCDGCDVAIDHEPVWKYDDTNHWAVCPHNEEKIMGEAAAHTFGDWNVTKEATEYEAGEKTRVCSVCGKEEKAAIEKLPHTTHDYTYNSKVVAPTCEDKGYTENFCKCGASQKTDEVVATGHTWGEWKVTKEATLTSEGEKTRTCTVETCKKVETEKIDKIAHECRASDILKGEKKPTCTEDGYTGDVICVFCERIIKQGSKVSPTGHDTKNAKIKNKKDATCTKIGYTGDKVCPLCEEVIEEGKDIKKLDHDWNDEGFCKVCKADKTNPKTGDDIMIAVYVMGASVAGLAACAFVYKKKFA